MIDNEVLPLCHHPTCGHELPMEIRIWTSGCQTSYVHVSANFNGLFASCVTKSSSPYTFVNSHCPHGFLFDHLCLTKTGKESGGHDTLVVNGKPQTRRHAYLNSYDGRGKASTRHSRRTTSSSNTDVIPWMTGFRRYSTSSVSLRLSTWVEFGSWLKVREILTDVSIYVIGLASDARKRYFSKLMFDKGLKTLSDPYKVPDEKWSRDLTNWPSLDFGKLYTYLILSPALFNPTSMRNYKSLEDYRYVESKHVQVVHYYNVEDSPYCFLRAAVTPSMRTRDKPHSAWVCLEKVSAEVYCAHCTCMAGLGETCSHVAAILFKVELAVRWRYTEKSSTDVGRMWNQHFKEQMPCQKESNKLEYK
ncbi:hypothetical protein MAR_014880 [Mya arenaria]|uniref:SWIM-type domain-containing protein n=1 Tax=Mya arenaria TaxID=6604 RepID=A0ABY7FNW3_MYAAR|nr:hypothetical protein MAR_014880 [Mya arenaria]